MIVLLVNISHESEKKKKAKKNKRNRTSFCFQTYLDRIVKQRSRIRKCNDAVDSFNGYNGLKT